MINSGRQLLHTCSLLRLPLVEMAASSLEGRLSQVQRSVRPGTVGVSPAGRHFNERASDALDVSIVIVTWNTCDDLLNCLASLHEQIPQSVRYEVIVVDNASTDQTTDKLGVLFPWVQVIANPTNDGFATANNIAIARAHGEFVLLLNPDTILFEDCITPLLAAMSDPAIGMICCKLLNGDRTIQQSVDLFPVLFREVSLAYKRKRRDFLTLINRTIADNGRCDVEVAIGAFMLMPHSFLVEIGMLDAGLFMYGEDIDLCFRVVKAGKRIVFDSSVAIIHLGGKSSEQRWSNLARLEEVDRSLFLVQVKHFGHFATVLSLAVRIVFGGIRYLQVTASGKGPQFSAPYLSEVIVSRRLFRKLPRLISAKIQQE